MTKSKNGIFTTSTTYLDIVMFPEPMENLHQPLCTFKCIKAITHECPYKNVLSIETSSCFNAETEPGMK